MLNLISQRLKTPSLNTPIFCRPVHSKAAAMRNACGARLILEGLPNVQTRKVTNSNGTIWHQVRTGPFDNRSMLNKAQDRLVRMNIQPLVKRID